jgi:hypothetical protein
MRAILTTERAVVLAVWAQEEWGERFTSHPSNKKRKEWYADFCGSGVGQPSNVTVHGLTQLGVDLISDGHNAYQYLAEIDSR